MARRRNKVQERDVAVDRITQLLARARQAAVAGRGERANRYAHLGLRIAQKYQTGLARPQKAQVCRACGTYRTSATSRTRLRGGRVIMTCTNCGARARRPLGP
jgi:ribonuclease P protein subunit RPR2